ncbi:MAG: hypothetical protein ACOCUT_03275 [bacterium]
MQINSKGIIKYPAQLFIFCITSDFIPSALSEIEKNNFIGLNGFQIANLVYGYQLSSGYNDDKYLIDFFNIV